MNSEIFESEPVVIRPARLDDVDALAALSHKTVLAKYPPIIGKDKVEAYVASGAVPAYYRDRNAYTQVADQAGTPIGAYALRDNSVDLMMVTLEHHRNGIGSALLAHAEAQLFARYDAVFLDSFRDNDQAVDFYKKHGWSIDREFHDEQNDIAMVRMVKSR